MTPAYSPVLALTRVCVRAQRGDPCASRPFHLSVLVAYNHHLAPSEMLEINLLGAQDVCDGSAGVVTRASGVREDLGA